MLLKRLHKLVHKNRQLQHILSEKLSKFRRVNASQEPMGDTDHFKDEAVIDVMPGSLLGSDTDRRLSGLPVLPASPIAPLPASFPLPFSAWRPPPRGLPWAF